MNADKVKHNDMTQNLQLGFEYKCIYLVLKQLVSHQSLEWEQMEPEPQMKKM